MSAVCAPNDDDADDDEGDDGLTVDAFEELNCLGTVFVSLYPPSSLEISDRENDVDPVDARVIKARNEALVAILRRITELVGSQSPPSILDVMRPGRN